MKYLEPDEVILLTANRLLDGRIVWRDGSGQWSESVIGAAQMTPDEGKEALEKALACAQQEAVVGIYKVIARAGPVPELTIMREYIRAFGPSVHPAFAYGEKRA